MSKKLLLLYVLLLLGVQSGLSQILDDQKKKADELKKEAVVFLRETAVDVGTLRTLENRISFASEIANLMWFHDEKEARAMFQTAIVDFRQLLIQADAQFTILDVKPSEDSNFDPLTIDPSYSREKFLRKFRKTIGVRQQITLSIIERDPQMAYDFFISTSQAVANPVLRKEIENSDAYFEMKLADALAETDVDKALEAGRRRLAKGASFELISLLKKIYEKDADKGVTFGEEIVSKIKSDNNPKSVNFYLLSSLLGAGADNLDKIKDKPGKKPMFSDFSLREIADLLAQEILKKNAEEASQYAGYVTQIERFSPSRAAQIRQKFGFKDVDKTNARKISSVDEEVLLSMPNSMISEKKETREEFFEDVQKLNSGQLSKEERKKVIDQSRQIISRIQNREQKIIALSALAAQVYKLGDKELASEIMIDARNLVNLQPKNYKDFLGIWMLASGYAMADPDKAFPLLEDAILRLNDTISAMIKIGEFMDVEEEIIENGEVQVGAFGGSMTRELLGALGASNPTIHALANADFARTKALTNKFDRTEVRILAKMLVMRAVLGSKELQPGLGGMIDVKKP
jgi:hypothetical protein